MTSRHGTLRPDVVLLYKKVPSPPPPHPPSSCPSPPGVLECSHALRHTLSRLRRTGQQWATICITSPGGCACVEAGWTSLGCRYVMSNQAKRERKVRRAQDKRLRPTGAVPWRGDCRQHPSIRGVQDALGAGHIDPFRGRPALGHRCRRCAAAVDASDAAGALPLQR